MANEIRANGSLSIVVNSDSVNASATNTLSLTGSKNFKNVQSVGTAFEQVDFNDLGDCKVLYLRNNSTGSVVSCSMNSAGTSLFAYLYPYGGTQGLDFVLFTPTQCTQSVWIKSTTGNADVVVVLTES